MTQFNIGQPVVDDRDNTGFVFATGPAQPNMYILGRTRQPILQQIDVLFTDRMSKDLDEFTVSRWAERAAQLLEQPATPEYLLSVEREVNRKAQAFRIAQEARIQEGDRLKAIFQAEAAAKMPAWAKSVIVAEHDVDRSDSMTDYFGHTTDKVLILGWSKHTRDLFSEMRKAASKAPETAHLGTGKGVFHARVVLACNVYSNGGNYYQGGYSHWHSDIEPPTSFDTRAEAEVFCANKGAPESIMFDDALVSFTWRIFETEIEHREKYSMGSGYYLKAGSSDSTGWKVCKRTLYQGVNSVPVGEWRI